jgi:hypothetical protein
VNILLPGIFTLRSELYYPWKKVFNSTASIDRHMIHNEESAFSGLFKKLLQIPCATRRGKERAVCWLKGKFKLIRWGYRSVFLQISEMLGVRNYSTAVSIHNHKIISHTP